MEIQIILILFLVSFAAGFVDSIAGGGGLLLIPALLTSGISPQFALGTNKLASSLGTSIAVVNFLKKKLVAAKIIATGIAFSFVGSYIGSRTVMLLDEQLVGKIIVFLLPIGIVATLWPKNKNVTKGALTDKEIFWKVPFICVAIGFYDGFFGPGTGSLLALSFHVFLRLGLLESTAHAKVFNLLSNLGGLIAFMVGGKVIYTVGIPLAIANMLGNYTGSHLAIKKGAGFIKVFLVIVLFLLIGTLGAKYFL